MIETIVWFHPLVFFGAVILLAVAELFVPLRAQTTPLSRRWIANIGLYGFGLGIQRLFLPVSAFVVSDAAIKAGPSTLEIIAGSTALSVVLGILLLDCWKYVEHRLFHHVPILWRLHLVHHSDLDTDFTTTERHHPLEAILGIGGLLGIVYLLTIPPLAIAIYFLIAPGVSLFSHANVRVPVALDRWLRWVIVTPSVHIIHHSAAQPETDSNFGTLLTVWDRIFGTYRTSSTAEDAARVIGLEYFRDQRWGRLDKVLFQPFVGAEARGRSIPVETATDAT